MSEREELLEFYKDLSVDLSNLSLSLQGNHIKRLAENITSLDKKRDERDLKLLKLNIEDLLTNFNSLMALYKKRYREILSRYKKFPKDVSKIEKEDSDLIVVISNAKSDFESILIYANKLFEHRMFHKIDPGLYNKMESLILMTFQDFLFK